MFKEECANVAKNAFGDITLSLAEVKKVASEITFADMAEELSNFAQATAETESALNNLQSAVGNLKKKIGKWHSEWNYLKQIRMVTRVPLKIS